MNLPDGVPLLPPDVLAPEMQVLRYTSHSKLYSIPSEAKPTEGDHEGLTFRESHEPESHPDLPGNVGRYRIIIEGSVGSSGELLSVSSKIRKVAEDLDKFWTYACGEPLNPLQIRLNFQVIQNGWESNEESVKQYLLANCHKPIAVVKLGKKPDWNLIHWFPLMPALVARDEYQKAGPPIQALVDIHHQALKSNRGESRLFLFAKALELARKLMPGRTDVEKQKSLHPDAQAKLKQSLHWLFNIANNRYEVRHVVVQVKPDATLHPKMTGKEILEFEHDAELVVKAVVFQRLNLKWPIPHWCKWKDDASKDKGHHPMQTPLKSSASHDAHMIGGVSIEMS